MKQVVSEDQARREIGGWLDIKRISERKREQYKDQEDILVEAITTGDLIVTDGGLQLTLLFPTNDGEGVSVLKFKNRLTVGERQATTKGVAANDAEGRLIAYIAALTDQPTGVIKKLESGEDYERASAIAVYFL